MSTAAEAKVTGAITVVDFGKFLDGTQKQQVADAIIQSFKETGFVYLINHCLPRAKIDAMFQWVCTSFVHLRDHEMTKQRIAQSQRFFSEPMDVKMLAPHPPSGTHHRGKCSLLIGVRRKPVR